jgi:hypothetical protein
MISNNADSVKKIAIVHIYDIFLNPHEKSIID